jgi:hypothetical protein
MLGASKRIAPTTSLWSRSNVTSERPPQSRICNAPALGITSNHHGGDRRYAHQYERHHPRQLSEKTVLMNRQLKKPIGYRCGIMRPQQSQAPGRPLMGMASLMGQVRSSFLRSADVADKTWRMDSSRSRFLVRRFWCGCHRHPLHMPGASIRSRSRRPTTCRALGDISPCLERNLGWMRGIRLKEDTAHGRSEQQAPQEMPLAYWHLLWPPGFLLTVWRFARSPPGWRSRSEWAYRAAVLTPGFFAGRGPPPLQKIRARPPPCRVSCRTPAVRWPDGARTARSGEKTARHVVRG